MQEGNRAALIVEGVPGRGWPIRVEGEVWFGKESYRWVVDHGELWAGEDRHLDLVVPREAALHPLAADYVSSLTLRVQVGGMRFYPPNAYAAFPHGLDHEGVVWTEPAMLDLAPGGVLDPALRSGAPHGVRLLPPLYDTVAVPAEDTGLGGRP